MVFSTHRPAETGCEMRCYKPAVSWQDWAWMTSRSCQWRCLCVPRVCSIMRLTPQGSWQQTLPLPRQCPFTLALTAGRSRLSSLNTSFFCASRRALVVDSPAKRAVHDVTTAAGQGVETTYGALHLFLSVLEVECVTALTRQSAEHLRNLTLIPREGRPRILRSAMPVSTADTVQMPVHGGVWYTLVLSMSEQHLHTCAFTGETLPCRCCQQQTSLRS